MCQLSYISTLGQINDKELRSKTQKRQSVKQIRKTYFTYCVMGIYSGQRPAGYPLWDADTDRLARQ